MREIKLTQGQVALVSDWRYDSLNQWKWHAVWKNNGFYAARYSETINGKEIKIYMHRLILNLFPGDVDGDHIDGNSLNNQDDNLRPDPERRNAQNYKTPYTNTSGYKGVTWYKSLNKWCARITFKNKTYHLGYFDILEDAARAYNIKALEFHGEFARLNIIK